MGELVRSLSSRDEVIDCAGHETGVPCPFAADCRLREALARAREAFMAELDLLTVRDLVRPGRAGATGPVSLGLPAMGSHAAAV